MTHLVNTFRYTNTLHFAVMTSNGVMRIIRALIIAPVLLIYVCTATLYPTVLHLDQLCGETVTVNGDVRITLSEKTYLSSNAFCALTLKPDKGAALVANFRRFGIDPRYRNTIDECRVEAVQLTWPGGDYFGDRGYCGSGRPGDQYMLGNLGTLSYTTWNGSDILTADVDLLVSEIFYKTDACPKGTFDCGVDNFCIDEDLTCNGYKDCGNGSDEGGRCTTTIKPGVIAAIVAGVVFAVILAAVGGLLIRRHRMRTSYTECQ